MTTKQRPEARVLWQRDLPFHLTTINPHNRAYRRLFVLDDTPEALAAAQERVAHGIGSSGFPFYGWGMLNDTQRAICFDYARVALSALHPALGKTGTKGAK